VVALLAWTAFVWVGRIRNALADPALDDGGRTGPILLSLSFLVPAAAVAVLLARSWRGGGSSALRAAVLALAGWSVAVWVVRVADIALAGDHEVGFVVVHAVLGVGSILLAVLAARCVTARPRSVDAIARRGCDAGRRPEASSG
jgi:hypothetical protein